MRTIVVVTVLVVAAGCKFPELPPLDGDAAHDGNPGDGADPDAGPQRVVAVAAGTDYQSPGTLGAIDVATATLTPGVAAGTLASDPVVRFLGDEVFVVNRFSGGNVVVLDPDGFTMVFTGGTGAGTNPQDVAVVGDKLFVPALATTGVRVLDRSMPGTIRSIDLSSLDPDLRPDCVSAYAVGTTVIVACGLLDGAFQPRGVGKLVYIDATTEQVTMIRDLPVANPVGQLHPTPVGGPLAGDLLIGTLDASPPDTGCVVRVPRTPGTATCLVTHATVGAGVDVFTPSANGATVWLVAGGRLRGYDVLGSSLAPPISPTTQRLVALAACADDTLVVGDQNTPHGARLYRFDVETTAAPLALGKAPGFGNTIACFRR